MMRHDSAALRVLYLGGTGTISTSCVRLSVEAGLDVHVLNRGNNAAGRDLPEGVTWLVGDASDDASLLAALGDLTFDAVINFVSFDAADVARMVRIFGGGRTRQYVHISSGSVYSKPVWTTPISESTPAGPNPVLPYATAKWGAEVALQQARTEQGFPVTIVRPSHTYDDANPPLAGGWTVVDRIARGVEVPVHGDGTSLWTLTHAEDFAQGLVGLIGPHAVGEVVHITSDDVLTWDLIHTLVGEALGVEPRLVHVPSELYPVVAPDWFWSGEVLGDIGHSAVFDNSKVRRLVPSYAPRLTFARAVHRMARWRADHPETTGPDAATEEVLDRIVGAYHAGRAAFAERAPQGAGDR